MIDLLPVRAKGYVDEIWYEGDLVDSGKIGDPILWLTEKRYNDCGSIFSTDSCDDTFIWRRIEPDTVSRPTNLKDINNQRIYENYILELKRDNVTKRGLVVYGTYIDHNLGVKLTGFFFKCQTYQEQHYFTLDSIVSDIAGKGFKVKIIGNIFDNAALLKNNS